MKITAIENRLSDYGSGGYYLFESFIIRLLKLEAESQKKPLIVEGPRSSLYSDAFAPEGLSGLPGPLSIEIVQVLTTKRLESELSRHESLKKSKQESLLIISLREISDNSDYIKALKSRYSGAVFIWSAAEIQTIIDKHGTAASALSEKMFSLRFERAISNAPDNWESKRIETLAEVDEHYRSGRFSIFLGAGVSSSAGLPDWDTLLNSMFVSMLTDAENSEKKIDAEQVSSIVKRLRAVDGPSALMLARYIRKGLAAGSGSEQSEFILSVTKQLYSLRDQRFSLASPLIKSIVSLCMPSRTGAKVKSVITYNFDDLLERELANHQLSYRSIFEDIDLPRPEELPIYHVHGILPEDRTKFPNIDKATLVFSEEGYHQIYGAPYHWSNLIQLSTFKENSCLMIGLSLTDPNLRRLLEISSKSMDKPKHFAFLKRINYSAFFKDNGGTPVRAPAALVRKFLDRHHSLNEEVMRELGVTIIWYKDYDEIPKLLGNIGKHV